MGSRERALAALNFQEPDRIPFDLVGTTWTGITNTSYQNLCDFLEMANSSPNWSDVIQQIVIPSEEMMARLKVDTRGVFPLTSHNWDVFSKCVDREDYLEYRDEWSFVHHFPKNGFWFSIVKHPMEDVDFSKKGMIEKFDWPYAGDK